MVKSARHEYLETIRKRYRKARKKDKKPIVDEFCANCGYRSAEPDDDFLVRHAAADIRFRYVRVGR